MYCWLQGWLEWLGELRCYREKSRYDNRSNCNQLITSWKRKNGIFELIHHLHGKEVFSWSCHPWQYVVHQEKWLWWWDLFHFYSEEKTSPFWGIFSPKSQIYFASNKLYWKIVFAWHHRLSKLFTPKHFLRKKCKNGINILTLCNLVDALRFKSMGL